MLSLKEFQAVCSFPVHSLTNKLQLPICFPSLPQRFNRPSTSISKNQITNPSKSQQTNQPTHQKFSLTHNMQFFHLVHSSPERSPHSSVKSFSFRGSKTLRFTMELIVSSSRLYLSRNPFKDLFFVSVPLGLKSGCVWLYDERFSEYAKNFGGCTMKNRMSRVVNSLNFFLNFCG